MNDDQILQSETTKIPFARLLWTAIVDVGDRQDLGFGPRGQRYLVPIVGGRFFGADASEGLQGTVVSGGADRQLIRADGVKELDALYEMKLDDGPVMTVHNRVIVDESRQPERYAMSVMSVTVEEGPFAWLNRRLILGTLESLRPQRDAVVVRAWEMDA